MEPVIILLYLALTAATFALGFVTGVVATVFYISRQMKKAQRELERRLSTLVLPPPSEGEEWQKGNLKEEDENWLRRRLDDDKDKK